MVISGGLGVAKTLHANEAHAPGLWTLIETQTVSDDSTIEITSFDSSQYSRYRVEFERIVPATDNVELYMRISSDSGSTWVTGSAYEHYGFTNGTSSSVYGYAQTAFFQLSGSGIGNDTNEYTSGHIEFLTDPSVNDALKPIRSSAMVIDSTGGIYWYNNDGVYSASNADINGIQFYCSSGNISTGTFKFYGLNK